MNANINKNTISVTGGSGHLGTCLIELLLHKGFTVNALYRNYLPPIKHPKLTWIQGDILDKSLNTFFQNSSTIIHCASLISLGNKDKHTVLKINVDGTQQVIDQCLKFNTKLIYISSSNAVLEPKSNEIFTEDRPYKTEKDFTYGYSKALAEQLVLKAIDKSNLDAFIIRPSAIVGPPDFKPSLFGKTIYDLSKGKLPAITNGGYNIIDVRDLSETIINSLKLGKSGEIYLVGGFYLSIKEIAAIANSKKIPVQLSINFLLFILPLIKVYQNFFNSDWPITKESLMVLKKAPKRLDASKAIQELKHSSRPVEQTIRDVISWFTKNTNS